MPYERILREWDELGYKPEIMEKIMHGNAERGTSTLDEALDAAGHFQGLAHHTADHAEAVASFFDKRKPVFRGH
jgi:enoyl-CoA hydratase/carnithine racemase